MIAAGALAGSVVLSLLLLLRPESYWFAILASFCSFAVLGYPVAALLLLGLRRGVPVPLRRWVTAAVVLAVSGSLFHGLVIAPAFVGAHPGGPADLRVLTLNLRLGHGDAGTAVRLVRDQRIDLAVFEELTPELQARMSAAGIGAMLPYRAGRAGPGAAGTVVYSAYPLSGDAPIGIGHGIRRVRVAAPSPFTLVAVHASQPLSPSGRWRADWSVLDQVLTSTGGPVLAVGDFNATLNHGPVRELLGDGFRDAARDANSGWQPTWPSGGRFVSRLPLRPGLIAIDHVLMTVPFRAVGTRTFVVPGSDHRALVAGLTW